MAIYRPNACHDAFPLPKASWFFYCEKPVALGGGKICPCGNTRKEGKKK
jgi:hypothetical protein